MAESPAAWAALKIGILVWAAMVAWGLGQWVASGALGPALPALAALGVGAGLYSFLNPRVGLLLFLSAVLLIPYSLRLKELPLGSPNLALGALAVSGLGLLVALRRVPLVWSAYYLLLGPLLALHIAAVALDWGPHALGDLTAMLEGIFAFVLGSHLLRSGREARLAAYVVLGAYTVRSLYLVLFVSLPSFDPTRPFFSGGLGALRYQQTIYDEPAALLAWSADLMLPLALALAVQAQTRLTQGAFGLAFVAALAVSWLSFSLGGALGSLLVMGLVAVSLLRSVYRTRLLLALAVGSALVLAVASTTPLVDFIGARVAQEQPGQARFGLYQSGLEMLPQAPLFGLGPGNASEAHSLLLVVGLEYGPLYLGGMLALFGLAIWSDLSLLRGARSARTQALAAGLLAGSVGALFHALFDPTLRAVGYATLFWFLRAVSTRVATEER